MKIVIGIIVVLGLGWLLLGMGGSDDATTEPATEEAMEEGAMMEEGEAMEEGDAMMEEGDHSDGAMMEEKDGEAMEEGDAMMEESGEAMEEEAAQ